MQNDEAMASLQIREMPQEVYDALAERAKRERRSLAQQAIVELARIPELTQREEKRRAIDEIRERISAYGTRPLRPSPEDLIRDDRDR
jgi:hypothetical protein